MLFLKSVLIVDISKLIPAALVRSFSIITVEFRGAVFRWQFTDNISC